MATTTKTLNPLPFEALEPGRFEDVIRGLAYHFRPWINLEDTGSSGNDEGFDVRGWEAVTFEDSVSEEEEPEEERIIPVKEKRLWLFQAKREKEITPKKLKIYLDDIFLNNKGKLYGVVFACACDLSKDSRDLFISRMQAEGVQEFQIWARGDLETMLFQPINDNLLFMAFGISLQIKKRSVATEIKSKIALKAKLMKLFGGFRNPSPRFFLLRDINDKIYPFKDKAKDFATKPPWLMVQFHNYEHDGIVVVVKEYFAYVDKDGKHFAYTNKVNDLYSYNDPWADREKFDKERYKIFNWVHKKIPPENQAMLKVYGDIPFEKIVAIDPNGDSLVSDPHLYVAFEYNKSPFRGGYGYLESYQNHIKIPAYLKNEIKNYFPEKFPSPKKTAPLVPNLPTEPKIDN